MVRGELSSRRRWWYRLLLLAASVFLALLVALWLTEPGPLPMRLHIAFASLASVALGWIGVVTWILTRHSFPTALDRLATAWMATAACCLFIVVSLPEALLRGESLAALWLGVVGVSLLGLAVYLLRAAYRLRARLRAKLVEL